MSIINSRRSTALGLVLLVTAIAAAGWIAIRKTAPPEDFRLTALPQRSSAPDFRLTDFNGRPLSLADYRGRVVVVFFGFVRCPDVCPAELFKLAQVMKRLGPTSDRVQVLFITLDPERDTPVLLKGYVKAFDPHFVGLTGTTEQIDSVAKSYYVAHFKTAVGNDYTIDHSTATYVIDVQGQRRLIGSMDASVDDFVHDLKLLTRR